MFWFRKGKRCGKIEQGWEKVCVNVCTGVCMHVGERERLQHFLRLETWIASILCLHKLLFFLVIVWAVYPQCQSHFFSGHRSWDYKGCSFQYEQHVNKPLHPWRQTYLFLEQTKHTVSNGHTNAQHLMKHQTTFISYKSMKLQSSTEEFI